MRELIRDLGFAPAKTDAQVRALKREQDQQQLQVNQQQQVIEQQQRMIDELVKYAMSASIFRHLCGLTLLKDYKYVHNDGNRREFYFLRDAGYIEPRFDGFIEFNEGLNGRNIADIAEATPIGSCASNSVNPRYLHKCSTISTTCGSNQPSSKLLNQNLGIDV